MKKPVVVLAHDAKTEGRDLVVAFLREHADKIERGEYDADGVVVVFHERRGDQFKTATRRCNMDLLQEIGLLQCAIVDVSKTDG